MSFTSPLFWQIHNLVASITKKNFKGSREELNQLVDLYGPDARQFLIACLVEETHFRDQRGHHQPKDHQKVQLLAYEIAQAAARPNFATVICQALENPRGLGGTNARARAGAKSIITEDFLSQFCKTCKLALPHQVAVACGLCESSSADVVQEALKFLRSKAPELVAAGPGSLAAHPHLVHGVLWLLQTRPELTSGGAKEAAVLRDAVSPSPDGAQALLLPLLPPAADGNAGQMAACLANATALAGLEDEGGGAALDALLEEELGGAAALAELMRDLGYQCTKTAAAFRELIAEYGAERVKEPEVARVLGMLARTTSGLNDAHSGLAAGSFLRESSGELLAGAPDAHEGGAAAAAGAPLATGWDMGIVAQVLSADFGSLDWRVVASNLDHPDFFLEEPQAFASLVGVYKQASKAEFPLDMLFGTWSNTAGQLSFVRQALATPGVLGFGGATNKQERFGDGGGAEAEPWLALDLIASLLTLAEAGHYSDVRMLFVKPARACPELLLCGLAQCRPKWEAMRNELYAQLLPPFIGAAGNSAPHRDALMHRLWGLDRNLVLVAAVQDFAQRGFDALRSTVFPLAEALEGGLNAMLGVEDAGFALAFASVAAANKKIDMAEWLPQQFSARVGFAEAALAYANKHHATATADSPDQPLPSSSLKILLDCLQGNQVRSCRRVQRRCRCFSSCAFGLQRREEMMIVFEPATPTALSLALKDEAKTVFPHITRDGRLRARGSDPLPACVRACRFAVHISALRC